ncbi:hypothetical protein [Candidatus Accumulibacter sp. ACC003]|uniref:hypothetical protein n=1 Tax=Candidatus Accumulibacter sp. ACC003 TaxID=2823334 RepID=UPI0025C687E7|nr:hypothetical protein [Candidatus Accumulibacter sp. ACC003]
MLSLAKSSLFLIKLGADEGPPLTIARRPLGRAPSTIMARDQSVDPEISPPDRRDESLSEKVSRAGKNHPRVHRRDRRFDSGDGTIDDAHRSPSMSSIDRSM